MIVGILFTGWIVVEVGMVFMLYTIGIVIYIVEVYLQTFFQTPPSPLIVYFMLVIIHLVEEVKLIQKHTEEQAEK